MFQAVFVFCTPVPVVKFFLLTMMDKTKWALCFITQRVLTSGG
jgi:hypothetical protein